MMAPSPRADGLFFSDQTPKPAWPLAAAVPADRAHGSGSPVHRGYAAHYRLKKPWVDLPDDLAAPQPERDRVAEDAIRQAVRQRYSRVANRDGVEGGCAIPCCGMPTTRAETRSQGLGYTTDDLDSVPEGANMGLGCGNPQAIAALKPGKVVLDLGSGGGFDCFLAAQQVGDAGHVIGVDMTPEMISKARANAHKGDYPNVEFRLGEIENLPVADKTVDVIISNCVINLSPDKPRVFAEAYRVLRPGGRLAISDVVAFAELPEDARKDMGLYTGCLAGASLVSELEALLQKIGFDEIRVAPQDRSQSLIRNWAPGTALTEFVASATIEAVKPPT